MKNPKLKKFNHNRKGTDYIIGDLHGCLKELFLLMNHVNFDKTKDRMFSVGDLIDRGPESLNCAMLIYEPWFKCVRGNHEQMMIDSFLHERSGVRANSYDNWMFNGGQWGHRCDTKLIKSIAEDMDKLPYIISIGRGSKRVNIAHAEIFRANDGQMADDTDIDEWNFDEAHENGLIWGRHLTSHEYPESGVCLSKTFCGHTPLDEVLKTDNHVFIDTGAVFYHTKMLDTKLTMVRVSDFNTYTLNMRSKEITESSL